mmetsp:Transcript_17718/g.38281  ORF Transcript_17718/g.38281 Transcript_17718/m.38281 type:complete len:85 (-) Transcript_17718:4-258(-)
MIERFTSTTPTKNEKRCANFKLMITLESLSFVCSFLLPQKGGGPASSKQSPVGARHNGTLAIFGPRIQRPDSSYGLLQVEDHVS